MYFKPFVVNIIRPKCWQVITKVLSGKKFLKFPEERKKNYDGEYAVWTIGFLWLPTVGFVTFSCCCMIILDWDWSVEIVFFSCNIRFCARSSKRAQQRVITNALCSHRASTHTLSNCYTFTRHVFAGRTLDTFDNCAQLTHRAGAHELCSRAIVQV